MPERLRLSRQKGFRLPLGAKSVARPSRWGNPFMVWKNGEWYADTWDEDIHGMGFAVKCENHLTARAIATQSYQAAVDEGWHAVPTKDEIRAKLAGLSLACWCPLPESGETDWCHARILLEICQEATK